ncbi:unnamed protein product [Gongylonema pulchrum]|uniref:Protein kinase domain-containing protein n=1 Tax=Gongylonema pulchrum TaxID=637853 RepID=A0A183D4V8_9BILA|nr:unnamed protein product [Gongylonema pulchrum]
MDVNSGCGITYTENYVWLQRGTDLLGHGAFGRVHKGRNLKTGEFVAVKTCNSSGGGQLTREIELLRQMDSPFIVRFIATELVRYKALVVLNVPAVLASCEP